MQGRRDEALGLFFMDNVVENGVHAGKTISLAEYEKIAKSSKIEAPKTEKPKGKKDESEKEDGDE